MLREYEVGVQDGLSYGGVCDDYASDATKDEPRDSISSCPGSSMTSHSTSEQSNLAGMANTRDRSTAHALGVRFPFRGSGSEPRLRTPEASQSPDFPTPYLRGRTPASGYHVGTTCIGPRD